MSKNNGTRSPEREQYQRALLEMMSCRPVAYWPSLARRVGGVKCAVMLSQLLYWNGDKDVQERAGHWIWKTVEELEKETGLTELEQRTARRHLVDQGLIRTALKGVPPIWHYAIDMDKIGEILIGPQHRPTVTPSDGNTVQWQSHETATPSNVSRDSHGMFRRNTVQLNESKTTESQTTQKNTSSSSPVAEREEEATSEYKNLSPEFLTILREIGVFKSKLRTVSQVVASGITEEALCEMIDDVEKIEPRRPQTAALFLYRLENCPPGQILTKEQQDVIKRQSYITGEYADLIQH